MITGWFWINAHPNRNPKTQLMCRSRAAGSRTSVATRDCCERAQTPRGVCLSHSSLRPRSAHSPRPSPLALLHFWRSLFGFWLFFWVTHLLIFFFSHPLSQLLFFNFLFFSRCSYPIGRLRPEINWNKPTPEKVWNNLKNPKINDNLI